MRLAGRRVVVVGLGRSGRAAARLAVREGAEVVGVDLREEVEPIDGARLELGPHRRQTLLDADLVVVSPGVPPSQPDLVAAAEAGVPLVGELGFAADFLVQPMVAVTGTNGKSTVTSFTGQLLERAGLRPFVGGNLGNPLSNAVLDDRGWDVLVVEVSSYQLELPGSLRPAVGVILNLTPDHLARHGDMESYASTKCRLFERMVAGDLAIVPFDDPLLSRTAERVGGGTRAWLGSLPGVTRRDGRARIHVRDVDVEIDLRGLSVPGEHNRENAATAALLAIGIGADPAAVAAAVPHLEALPHRMEIVAEHDGVVFVNDSKATNIDAARVGIGGLDPPAVVLLGGQAKGPGFAALAPLLGRHRAVVTFGGSGEAIADELEGAGVEVVRAGDLADAVQRARGLARRGDAVLLSPGCASFDAFEDFEHRGRVFRALVTGGDA